jgi:DNA-binding HxlR family transcriptional regulator
MSGERMAVADAGEHEDEEAILGRAAFKWNKRIVLALDQHPHRFLELKRAFDGATQHMVARSLRSLQRDGLVNRTEIPDTVLHVTYELTDLGRAAARLIRYNRQWVAEHLQEIRTAQERFDSDHDEI